MCYQPNQESHSPYLSRADVCLLIEQFSPRKIGKTQFYVWLELLEEEASEPYSNWVAAQMVKFGELLNRPISQGGTLEASRRDLRQIINTYESEQQFIEDVFHEAARRIQPKIVWVYPQAVRTGQTIEVESRATG